MFAGCKGGPEEVPKDDFDKEAMLKNMAEEVVQASYSDWESKVELLMQKASEFEASPSESKLLTMQDAFIDAYKSWNYCSVFEFGPAADKSLRLKVNIFPIDTAQIEANVLSGDVAFGNAQNAESVGFAALDYLLFKRQEELISSTLRQEYLKANINWVKELSEEVNTDWASYQSDFISNTSSGAGSPLSNLVNEINYEFELLKNARIGIPLGKKTLGVTQVHKLEGFYSEHSSELSKANLIGIKNAFNGGTGLGLDDYLNDLDVKKNGELLSSQIEDLFDQLESDLESLNLKSAIENEPSTLDPMYNRIEQLVVLLKVDMPSQLGVQITYQDNDGD
ncbi:imelysin family protein [bacterium]|nr:imelysin family protein [bacterium]MDC1222118.1 imelysin family protein [Salibacteraceae bacterium]